MVLIAKKNKKKQYLNRYLDWKFARGSYFPKVRRSHSFPILGSICSIYRNTVRVGQSVSG